MPTAGSFRNWLVRLRAGEPKAAAELVETFGSRIHAVIRRRLARLRMSRLIDTLDVSQAVFATFFDRIGPVHPRLRSADHLFALLVAIARNKVRDELRRHTASRRDYRRMAGSEVTDLLRRVESPHPDPSQVAVWKELCERALTLLTPAERIYFDARLAGRSWEAIGAEVGVPATLLRKKLNRALERLRRALDEDSPLAGMATVRSEHPAATAGQG